MGATAGWNHNTMYHPVVLDAVQPTYRRALDVGCGEGRLTRDLRQTIPEVTGVDLDPNSIAAAQANPGAQDIRYIQGDVLTHAFEAASFDLIAVVAALHHMPAVAALRRLDELLCPGGALVLVGCARSSWTDHVIDLAAILPNQVRRVRSPYWQHPSPTVWPPPETYRSMRQITAQVTPGAQFRRRLYWRYTVVWNKPQQDD